jgi:hypothetical protein
MVYSEPTNLRVTWPPPPDELKEAMLTDALMAVRQLRGKMEFTAQAKTLIDSIYQNFTNLGDVRLAYYNGRRLQHLLKLCMVMAAMNGSMSITYDHVLEANTILVYTEEQMHKAFGEYGASKLGKAGAKILQYMETAARPVDACDIHKAIAGELDDTRDLFRVLDNLAKTDRIQVSGSGSGKYILKKGASVEQRTYTDFKRFISEAEDYERNKQDEEALRSTVAAVATQRASAAKASASVQDTEL